MSLSFRSSYRRTSFPSPYIPPRSSPLSLMTVSIAAPQATPNFSSPNSAFVSFNSYNEEGHISPVLEAVRDGANALRALSDTGGGSRVGGLDKLPGVEVIVSDGGSTDRTREIAARFGARVLEAPSGRGNCLNFGAKHARGDVLLFLHGALPPPLLARAKLKNGRILSYHFTLLMVIRTKQRVPFSIVHTLLFIQATLFSQ